MIFETSSFPWWRSAGWCTPRTTAQLFIEQRNGILSQSFSLEFKVGLASSSIFIIRFAFCYFLENKRKNNQHRN